MFLMSIDVHNSVPDVLYPLLECKEELITSLCCQLLNTSGGLDSFIVKWKSTSL